MTTFEILRDDGTKVTPRHETNVCRIIPGEKFKVLIKRDYKFKSEPIVHIFINDTYRIEHRMKGSEFEVCNVLFKHLFEPSHLTLQPALNDVDIKCPITGDFMKIVKGKMYLRIVVVYPYTQLKYEHGYNDHNGDRVAAKHVYAMYLTSSEYKEPTTKLYVVYKRFDCLQGMNNPCCPYDRGCTNHCRYKCRTLMFCEKCGFPRIPMQTFKTLESANEFIKKSQCSGLLTTKEIDYPTMFVDNNIA